MWWIVPWFSRSDENPGFITYTPRKLTAGGPENEGHWKMGFFLGHPFQMPGGEKTPWFFPNGLEQIAMVPNISKQGPISQEKLYNCPISKAGDFFSPCIARVVPWCSLTSQNPVILGERVGARDESYFPTK